MSDATDAENLHFVGSTDDLPPGGRLVVDVKNREIALFNVDGDYYGLSNYCVHQGGPACEGRLGGLLTETDDELRYDRRGEIVSCPWHGWEFDVTTGSHVARPDRYRLPTYDVVESDGELYVRL